MYMYIVLDTKITKNIPEPDHVYISKINHTYPKIKYFFKQLTLKCGTSNECIGRLSLTLVNIHVHMSLKGGNLTNS